MNNINTTCYLTLTLLVSSYRNTIISELVAAGYSVSLFNSTQDKSQSTLLSLIITNIQGADLDVIGPKLDADVSNIIAKHRMFIHSIVRYILQTNYGTVSYSICCTPTNIPYKKPDVEIALEAQ